MIDELARIDPSFFLSFSNQPFSRFSSKSIDKNEISIGWARNAMDWKAHLPRFDFHESLNSRPTVQTEILKAPSVKSIPLQRILVVRIGQLSVL